LTKKRKPRDQEEFAFDADKTPAPEEDAGAAPDAGEDEPVEQHGGLVAQDGGPLQSLMDDNFLQYASYVICARAIPRLSDGLKPVQRRILHALHELDDGRFIKVANVVGHTMQYHPHGDAAIGDALVTLANKEYLIEKQGNFGNVFTGDSAAASRYIECRLTELARKELFNRELTEMAPSYDGRKKEPVALPAKIPFVLMLGAEGIAVGLSTRILPHNFQEVLEAQIAVLQKKAFTLFPDFPQGGLMEVADYEDGAGSVRVRARIEPRGKHKLVVTELPAGVTTESLIGSIEDAARKKKIALKGITDFTSGKVEIELDLSPQANLEKTKQALYAFTQCEARLNSNIVVIDGDRPAEFTVSEIVRGQTAQLQDTLKAELQLKQKLLEDEYHAKTLVQIFIEKRIYKKIEECKTYEAVQKAVLDGLKPYRKQLKRAVTSEDVEMLLGVRIRRISRFDIDKSRAERDAILEELKKVARELKNIKGYTTRYLRRLIKTYASAYPRRTTITSFDNIEVRELTARELTIKYDREKGFLGYDVDGEVLLECSSYDKLLVVWENGRYKMIQPPDRLFADKTLLHCAKMDRERVYTLVYRLGEFTYMKRFRFGGAILDREYFCTTDEAQVLLLDDTVPEDLYIKYRPAKGQRIHRQVFHIADLPVKGVKARGNRMTAKRVAKIWTSTPRGWDDAESPSGVLL